MMEARKEAVELITGAFKGKGLEEFMQTMHSIRGGNVFKESDSDEARAIRELSGIVDFSDIEAYFEHEGIKVSSNINPATFLQARVVSLEVKKDIENESDIAKVRRKKTEWIPDMTTSFLFGKDSGNLFFMDEERANNKKDGYLLYDRFHQGRFYMITPKEFSKDMKGFAHLMSKTEAPEEMGAEDIFYTLQAEMLEIVQKNMKRYSDVIVPEDYVFGATVLKEEEEFDPDLLAEGDEMSNQERRARQGKIILNRYSINVSMYERYNLLSPSMMRCNTDEIKLQEVVDEKEKFVLVDNEDKFTGNLIAFSHNMYHTNNMNAYQGKAERNGIPGLYYASKQVIKNLSRYGVKTLDDWIFVEKSEKEIIVNNAIKKLFTARYLYRHLAFLKDLRKGNLIMQTGMEKEVTSLIQFIESVNDFTLTEELAEEAKVTTWNYLEQLGNDQVSLHDGKEASIHSQEIDNLVVIDIDIIKLFRKLVEYDKMMGGLISCIGMKMGNYSDVRPDMNRERILSNMYVEMSWEYQPEERDLFENY